MNQLVDTLDIIKQKILTKDISNEEYLIVLEFIGKLQLLKNKNITKDDLWTYASIGILTKGIVNESI